jgi:hypothetical protein
MRQLALTALLVASAGMFGSAASAQDYGRYGDDRNSRGYGRDREFGPRGGDIVDRALNDLQRAASTSFYARHDRGRFDHAMRELSKFQNKWSRGKFDNHALDEAISEMSHLSRSGELNPRVRDVMARDADELRAFRAAGGRFDGRYDPRYRR